ERAFSDGKRLYVGMIATPLDINEIAHGILVAVDPASGKVAWRALGGDQHPGAARRPLFRGHGRELGRGAAPGVRGPGGRARGGREGGWWWWRRRPVQRAGPCPSATRPRSSVPVTASSSLPTR